LVLSRICPAVSLLASEIQMANTSDAEDMWETVKREIKTE
jgi:hypothetical protein